MKQDTLTEKEVSDHLKTYQTNKPKFFYQKTRKKTHYFKLPKLNGNFDFATTKSNAAIKVNTCEFASSLQKHQHPNFNFQFNKQREDDFDRIPFLPNTKSTNLSIRFPLIQFQIVENPRIILREISRIHSKLKNPTTQTNHKIQRVIEGQLKKQPLKMNNCITKKTNSEEK